MPSVRIVLCLLLGVVSARAQNWNQDVFQFKQQRPNQPAGQQPKAVPQDEDVFREPLSWRFPDPPAEDKPRFPPSFQLKTPAPAQSVSASCGESSVRVEAKKDLLGTGRPVRADDVTLGGCPATGEDPGAQVLIFESDLHGCGSQLQMSEETFSYVFTLLYTPSPLGSTPIVRGREVSISIECHYQRKQDVSSSLLKPTWAPFVDSKLSEESLYFSLKLMTDDWQFTHPNPHYFLGDKIKFEASVKQFQHFPLRVIVDSCVATVAPYVDTVPRYAFLGNSGCLFDGQLTGSTSRFLPRVQDDKVQFEVEAFRFEQDTSGVLYVTCSLRATAAPSPVASTNKDCSFSEGWREASGNHPVCSCCDTDCGKDGAGDPLKTGSPLEEERTVGPIIVKDKPL